MPHLSISKPPFLQLQLKIPADISFPGTLIMGVARKDSEIEKPNLSVGSVQVVVKSNVLLQGTKQ